MKGQKEIQEKYTELKAVRNQLDSAREQLEQLTLQLETVDESIYNLKEVSKFKASSEILVPVSNGVFIKANIADNSKFIVNVGAGAVIERNLSDVEQILMDQKKELSDVQNTITTDISVMENDVQKLSTELKGMMK